MPLISKEFYQLMKKLTIRTVNQVWGYGSVTTHCCFRGYKSLLKYVLDHGAILTVHEATAAVKGGHLECLKVTEEHGWTPEDSDLHNAIQYGQLHIVRYLVDKGFKPGQHIMPVAVRTGQIELVQFIQTLVTINIYEELGYSAAQSGNLAMVKFIEQQSPLKQSDVVGAAQKGSIEIMQYYLDKGFNLNDTRLCKEAAMNGHRECVRFLANHGAPTLTIAVEFAAKINDVELIRELRAKGCSWDGSAVKAAARMGSFEALQYLVNNGCPLVGEPKAQTGFGFGFGASFGLGNTDDATLCAASGGHLRCLQYLMEHGAPWPKNIIDQSISLFTSNADIIAYLRTQGCPWGTSTCETAAKHGKLGLLKYLHENGCPWNEATTTAAVRYASEFCLKYALEEGCPFHPKIIDDAVMSSGLATAKILFEGGVPWSERTCAIAIRKGKYDVLQYAHENGAALSDDAIMSGLESATISFDCFKYAVEHGCPWDPERALQLATSHSHDEIVEWIQNNAMNN